MQPTVLVVDDERNMLRVTRMSLEDVGYRVLTADSGEAALPLLSDPELAVMLSDLKMDGMSGEELIAHSRRERPDVPVVVMTAFGSIRSAVECIQAGASDYLPKPFEPEELVLAIRSAERLHQLLRENARLQAAVRAARPSGRLVGDSPAMQQLREEIARVAPFKTNLLITGESGSGKEAVARTIHESGPRAERPWVPINCSAIPRDLMESELFGYVRGAFTGAVQGRPGRLEQADGGTLFLDEIGDLDLALQGKLLRVLQEREFSPVGSDAIRRVDVRFIAATHRDLWALEREGRFRQDLLYRLDVYRVHVPPLRERQADIPLLASSFLERLSAEMGKPVAGFDPTALEALQRYPWPGNVRELRNAVERAIISCRDQLITLADLPEAVAGGAGQAGERPLLAQLTEEGLDHWLEAQERAMILAALQESQGVQVQAAKRLGISERSLWHRVKKLEIRIEREAR